VIQRGYIVLISGGALFAVGLAVSAAWGMQFAGIFLQDNTLVNAVSVEPGRSVDTTRQVTDTSRPLTVTVHIQGKNDNNGLAPLREDIRLVETVKDPSGAIVSTNEFSGNLFTSFRPEQTGNYVLTIANAGTKVVTVDGTFGYMPFMSAADGRQVDFAQLSGIIAGGALSVIGFLTIIAGIVIVLVDRPKKSSSTITSEGGITYRKD
jgi:uncharacterized iron-regulated membrane protein